MEPAAVLHAGIHGQTAENEWLAGIINLDAQRGLTKTLRVRLQRRGWKLTIVHRQEGGEWVEFYPLNVRAWPAKIRAGVKALNTSDEPFTAVFIDFTLTPDGPPSEAWGRQIVGGGRRSAGLRDPCRSRAPSIRD